MSSQDKPATAFPLLETKRLVLREIRLADASAILRNFSDEEVTKWFFDQPFTRLHQAEEIIREFGEKYQMVQGITWGICLKGENDVIGSCGFERFELGGSGEIGYDLAKEWWGKGLMREALQAILGYGFEKLELQRIEAGTYRTNNRSIALLERLGFQVLSVEDDSVFYALDKKVKEIHMDAYPLTMANRIRLGRAFQRVPRVDLSIECVLEGQMGKAFVDDSDQPQAFQVQIGPFVYFAGDPTCPSAQAMLRNLAPYTFFMPSGPAWLEAAQAIHGRRLDPLPRYSFSSSQLDRTRLEGLIQISVKDQIRRMDLAFAKEVWGQDHFVDLSEFDSPEDFLERGVGFFTELGGVVTGAAFSSLACSRGIEVSVYIEPAYRRRGLATLLAASLLRWCLENGSEPHWDAANWESCRLAEKMGYVATGKYQAYLLAE
jgi:RimJ/RimL family protein N-acetyltransferase